MLHCSKSRPLPDVQESYKIDTPAILMFYFTIFPDSTQTAGERIRLTRRETIQGFVKQSLLLPQAIASGDLVCSVYDQRNRLVFKQVQEDPLTTPKEFPNEDGTFGRARMVMDSAELFIRLQAKPDLSRLVIEKMTNEGKMQSVFELSL
jgi:hypothetical protein